MSKRVKDTIVKDYMARIGDAKDGMLISIRGVKGIPATRLRKNLASKKIKVTVLRNALAKKTLTGTALEPLTRLLTGPSALAYGGQSVIEVAREIVKAIATMPELELKGAVLDGQLFEGKKGVEELSKFPTREEALSQAVTLILGPGRKLMAQVKGPGAGVAGIIKSIEMKLEKGETIARKAG
jgi:large subunit ribosomal protein L10